jgi:polysaccharide export outer membrane protein
MSMPVVIPALALQLVMTTAAPAQAQSAAPPAATLSPGPAATAAKPVVAGDVTPPPGYLIGPEDVLAVVFWREKDLSVDAIAVRPDGMITVPLINDIKAAGTTPDQLREQIQAAAGKYVTDPSVTVVVKTINSRKVFITGQVPKPGQYPLTAPTSVMQLIAMAGGVHEFADTKHILIMRSDGGQQVAMQFNYDDVLNRKNLQQNIPLLPGDTVVVP